MYSITVNSEWYDECKTLSESRLYGERLSSESDRPTVEIWRVVRQDEFLIEVWKDGEKSSV